MYIATNKNVCFGIILEYGTITFWLTKRYIQFNNLFESRSHSSAILLFKSASPMWSIWGLSQHLLVTLTYLIHMIRSWLIIGKCILRNTKYIIWIVEILLVVSYNHHSRKEKCLFARARNSWRLLMWFRPDTNLRCSYRMLTLSVTLFQ